jgi:hypothetical protein
MRNIYKFYFNLLKKNEVFIYNYVQFNVLHQLVSSFACQNHKEVNKCDIHDLTIQ